MRLNKLCGSNNINLKYATSLIIIMDKLKQQQIFDCKNIFLNKTELWVRRTHYGNKEIPILI